MQSDKSSDESTSALDQPSRPIRLLLVTTELRPGGAEKCLVNLACGIESSRFQPLVVSIKSTPAVAERRLVDRLENAGIPTFFLNCDSKWSFWSAIRQLKRLIREQQIDVVHSFLIHANLLAGFVLRSFPDIRFFTGIRVADPSGIRHYLERLWTKRADKMVCVSQQVREFAQKEMKLPSDKLLAIPNGIEELIVDPDFSPETLGIQRPYVLFVGRLEEQKGLVPFFEELIARSDSLPDFDLVFVGDGSLREALQTIAKKLSRQCHWVGWQDQPQNLMHHAQCLILPSLWEGMPNVLLETMSLKKPFVAFGVDGVPEILEENNIQVIPAGDYEMFFQRLTEIVSNQELANETGLANRQRVESDFSLKKMIAKYETLYLDCLDTPSRR